MSRGCQGICNITHLLALSILWVLSEIHLGEVLMASLEVHLCHIANAGQPTDVLGNFALRFALSLFIVAKKFSAWLCGPDVNHHIPFLVSVSQG